jgi:hypothetical protein
MSKGTIIILAAFLVLSTAILTSCNRARAQGLAILLTDTGQVLLTENDIKAYHSDTNALELNEKGIKAWNSHLDYQDIPRLAESLFLKNFTLKIEGREICRGKFWSYASSATFSGVVIFDALFKLDSDHNSLWIKSDFSNMLDPTTSSELNHFFAKHNLLAAVAGSE